MRENNKLFNLKPSLYSICVEVRLRVIFVNIFFLIIFFRARQSKKKKKIIRHIMFKPVHNTRPFAIRDPRDDGWFKFTSNLNVVSIT